MVFVNPHKYPYFPIGLHGALEDVGLLDIYQNITSHVMKRDVSIGYCSDGEMTLFCDRCEVGTHHWAQCNDVPVKYARFPVTGLVEGRTYIFRVRALNKAGVSRPSRVSDTVVAMDPSDRARLRGETHTRALCSR